jgi:hypothetical protein
MSHKKHGQLTTSPEWARHLRPLLRRWFWKGERRAVGDMLRDDSERATSADSSIGSVEALLNEVTQWSDAAASADLWVPDELTLQGRAVAKDIAMAIVLDKILALGLFPSGFSTGDGGRLYHYKRERSMQ